MRYEEYVELWVIMCTCVWYCLSWVKYLIGVNYHVRLCCISFESSCSCYSLRRRGGGSTGVVREPRHRPLFLVPYRTASTREFSPPSQLAGALNTRSLGRPRPPMVGNHWHTPDQMFHHRSQPSFRVSGVHSWLSRAWLIRRPCSYS